MTSEEQADLTQQLALILKHLAEDAPYFRRLTGSKAYQARYRPPVSTAAPKITNCYLIQMQKALQQLANLRAQGNTKG